ncbi:MAG: hypothetical protein WA091_02945 [Minisyncoccales bacterium]
MTLLIIVMGVILMVLLSIAAYLSCKMLQDMPDNDKEVHARESWTGPVRASYITIVVTWLIFIAAAYLLASSVGKIQIVYIAAMAYNLSILMTAAALAYFSMFAKRQLAKGKPIYIGRLHFL